MFNVHFEKWHDPTGSSQSSATSPPFVSQIEHSPFEKCFENAFPNVRSDFQNLRLGSINFDKYLSLDLWLKLLTNCSKCPHQGNMQLRIVNLFKIEQCEYQVAFKIYIPNFVAACHRYDIQGLVGLISHGPYYVRHDLVRPGKVYDSAKM
jgi:hypothetical protein